ncbi:hypothetical protein ACUSIJ_28885 [Pseudochelatococcus sp. B33]
MVLALDIAKVTGFAFGKPGAIARSGSVRLGDDPRSVCRNLLCFLREQFFSFQDRPELVAIEAPLNAVAHPSASSIPYAFGGAYVADALCWAYGARVEFVNVDRVRKHFIGKPRTGNREDTKRAVIQRCVQLGYLPKECRDDNRADACGLHDYASAVFAKHVPASLQLFGESRQ